MEFLDWKSVGSLLATVMFLRTAIRDFLPPELYGALKAFSQRVFAVLQPNVSILIEEYDAAYNNELFDSVQLYLSSRCFSSAKILKLSKPKNSKTLTFTMDAHQKIDDNFDGASLRWSLNSIERKTHNFGYVRSHEARFFELTFHRRHKDAVHTRYLPYVMEEAATIRFKTRERKLYTNRSAEENGRLWSSVPFSHPSSFDTVAIDPALKDEIQADLRKFTSRREFYSRVGRAWKRGYLLYGPPGTGKTSLIAAIANFLEFDIYDLELTAVTSNSQLRKLLIATSSKSVIVVEDVDCTLDLSDRKSRRMVAGRKLDKGSGDQAEGGDQMGKAGGKEVSDHKTGNGSSGGGFSTVSLSGILNFVDGLWSSCGGERLMIFTTNHKEKLDQALLRAGRMDKHIHLSYCEFPAFKTLLRNYLYLEKHEMVEEVKDLLPAAKMTPADVAEVFMSCEDEADRGMRNLVVELKKRVAAAAAAAVAEEEEKSKMRVESAGESLEEEEEEEEEEEGVAVEEVQKKC